MPSNPISLSRVQTPPGSNASPGEWASWASKTTDVINKLTRAVMLLTGNEQINATTTSTTAAITSLTTNSGTQVRGDVSLNDGASIDLTQSGQDITVAVDTSAAGLGATFLRRDGGNTITGDIAPDGDGTRRLGASSNALLGLYSTTLFGNSAGLQIKGKEAIGRPALTFDATAGGGIVLSTGATNLWQAGSIAGALLALQGVTPLNGLATATGNYAMGSNKLTGLAVASASGEAIVHSLNPLNHLATATAAYNMAGNTFTNLGGCTSSNAALLELVGNIADGSDVVGINLRWNRGATPAAGRYALVVQDNDATGARDLLKMGYRSAGRTVLWLPDKDGGGHSAVTENHIVSGDNANINSGGTVGFGLFPNDYGGSMWVYVAGEVALDIRRNVRTVALGAAGAGYVLSTNDVYFQVAATPTGGNFAPGGQFQFLTAGGTITPASGRLFAYSRGSGPLVNDHTEVIAYANHLGHYFSGQNGDITTAPADGMFGAAGWVDASNSNNQTGADVYYAAGPGTGNSTTKGGILFQTPDAGVSGTAIQALTTKGGVTRLGRLYGKELAATGDVGGAASQTSLTNANPALGGGAAPTVGTIGGSGPATATQNSWVKIYVGTTAMFIPVWA